MAFERILSDDLIEKLKNEDLFKNYLLPDIKIGIVFPAIRKNEIHFYYKGGRLFKYTDKGFFSHIKYAFVCPDCYQNGDINQSDLEKLDHINDFTLGYDRIKENCEKYNQGHESEFVSRLFKQYSYINPNTKDDIVLLDIEASLESQNEDKYQDRFDIVLLNKNTSSIRVVEAKLYSNPELKVSRNSKPQVISQIKRYEENIEERKSEIINAYTNYLKIIRKIFDVDLPHIQKIEPKVGLLYFDFDGDNKSSDTFKNLKKVLKEELSDNKIYPNGHMDDVSLKLLF